MCAPLCLPCLAAGAVEPTTSPRGGRLRRSSSALALAALVAAGGAGSAAMPASGRSLPARAVARRVPITTVIPGGAPPAPAPAAAPMPPPPPPPAPAAGPGYRLIAADGGVFTHGWLASRGAATGLAQAPVDAVAQTPDGEGYWLAAADGGVYAFGTAGFYGSASGLTSSPVVGMAAAPSGQGYWLVTDDGGLFAFGDATYGGSGVEVAHDAPFVAVAATASGQGYWLVTGDGGVFAFGDAGYFGSAAGITLRQPIVTLVPTATGGGYWLVSSDGGVFAFGDAGYFGGLADGPLRRPIVDMAASPSGQGYWLVASDGGVFAFGDAPFVGSSANARLNAPITAMVAGVGVHEPGPLPVDPPAAPPAESAAPVPAPAAGAVVPAPGAGPVARVASGPGRRANDDAAARRGAALADGRAGWDISWPQCGGAYPDGLDFAVVGITGGKAFTTNPCLDQQWQWARSNSRTAGVYLNINFPKSADDVARGASSPYQPDCGGAPACVGFNFGWNAVKHALAYAAAQHVDPPFLWLDVETLNYWTPDKPFNAVVVRGAIAAATDSGVEAGIYSTPSQWARIMGDEAPGVPVWSAGAPGVEAVGTYCATRGFGGGPVAMVQILPSPLDTNVVCPGAGPISRYFAP